jgi:hypothetical protein
VFRTGTLALVFRTGTLAAPVLLGSVYVLPQVVHATFKAEGRVDALLLGRHVSQHGPVPPDPS